MPRHTTPAWIGSEIRNSIHPARRLPYQTPVALQYDSGDYFATLEAALKHADWAGFEARRTAAKARGKLRGIGVPPTSRHAASRPRKWQVRSAPVPASMNRQRPRASNRQRYGVHGTHSHGQGHETTLAQLVTDQLGVPFANVDVVHGDTAKIPFGMGTYGSRSLAVGGSAMVKAMDKIIAKGKKIAAHLMEADVHDIEFKDGKFTVAGTDKVKTFGEIALTATCRTTTRSRNWSRASTKPRSTTRRISLFRVAATSAKWSWTRYRHHDGSELHRR